MEQSPLLADLIRDIGKNAREASRILAAVQPAVKVQALETLACLLESNSAKILKANAQDMEQARAANMDEARLGRLFMTEKTIHEMATACRFVAAQSDPVGAIEEEWQQPNGILVGKMRVPLGVVAMVYEARPNVTIDAAIICLKAGNAVILRGGSEAFASNQILAAFLQEALTSAGLPAEAAQVLPVTDRAAVQELCKLDEYIDVMIPRGGEELVRTVTAQATMPVLKHYKGVCHAFVDESADIPMALDIVRNAKVQRPGVCNALECLLVHEKLAPTFLPQLEAFLPEVELRACSASLPYLQHAVPLQASDKGQEFHSLILAVLLVPSLDAALNHIAKYGSHHTEIICTNNLANSQSFLREADASMVAVNASTRFNDGGQLGLGAEIGISTSKLHAYGPMGVKELTTTKFVVTGKGHTRA